MPETCKHVLQEHPENADLSAKAVPVWIQSLRIQSPHQDDFQI